MLVKGAILSGFLVREARGHSRRACGAWYAKPDVMPSSSEFPQFPFEILQALSLLGRQTRPATRVPLRLADPLPKSLRRAEECSSRCSSTIRIARSGTSGENLLALPITPSVTARASVAAARTAARIPVRLMA